MERIESLQHLLLHELRDVYHAEKQLIKALPKLAKKTTSPELKQALDEHLGETEGQVERLEQIFELLGQPAKAVKCEGMAGIVKEGQEMLRERAAPETLDAAIITAAQKVEHYEIAAYGSMATWAQTIGRSDVKQLLGQTLEEEEKADRKLSELAKAGVNLRSAEKMREAA